jgi:cytochrome oxidase Cu insertion factor (SCO1/SenC/PrrC family)
MVMKIVILYHPESDHARRVEEYAHDFERIYPQKVDLLSLETREGADMARLYDVVRYPALLALRDTGEMLQMWVNDQLPLMDEVAAYANTSSSFA